MSEGPVATAYVNIEPDLSGFATTLRRETNVAMAQFRALGGQANGAAGGVRNLSSATSGLGSNLKGLGLSAATAGVTALATAAVAGTAAIVALGTALTFRGLQGASNLQALELRFTAIQKQLRLGGESVDSFIESLRDLELQTGLSTQTLGNSVTRFTGFGLTARQATQSTVIFGDALATLGITGGALDQTLASITTQLSQAGAVGKFAGDELRSILENLGGLVTRQQLAQQVFKDTGVSVADTLKALSEGTLDFGVGFNAITALLADPSRGFAGGLERQAKTLPGVIQRIKATFDQGLQDAFLPTLTTVADSLNSFLTDNQAEIAAFGQGVADAFAQISPTLIASLPAVMNGLALSFELLTPLIAQSAEAFAAIAGAIVDNQDSIRAVGEDLGNFAVGLVSLFDAVGPSLLLMIDQLETSGEILGSLGDILQFLEPLFEVLGVTGAIAMAAIQAPVEVISVLLNVLSGDIDGVASSLSGLGNAAVSVYNQIAAILPLVGAIGEEIGSAPGVKGGGGFMSNPGYAASQAAKAAAAGAAAGVSALPRLSTSSAGAAAGGAAGRAAASEAKKRADAIIRATEAAFKTARGIAKKTADQSVDEIANAFDRLYEDLRESGNKSFIKGAKEIEARLLQVARRRDRTIEQLESATDKLADLKQEALGFNQSIRDSINQLGNVSEPTAGIATTFLGIKNNLIGAIASARQFGAAISQLTALGLNQTSLRQLIEAGPEAGLASAQALSRSGAAGIAEINALQGQLGAQAVKVSDSITDTFYKAGISAAQGLVAGLQSQEAAIEAQMNRIGDRLVRQLKRALKINSPSLVLANEVGVPAGQGIVKGLVAALGGAGSAGSRSIQNYATTTIGPITVNGVQPGQEQRAGAGFASGIEDVLARQLAAATLGGFA